MHKSTLANFLAAALTIKKTQTMMQTIFHILNFFVVAFLQSIYTTIF